MAISNWTVYRSFLDIHGLCIQHCVQDSLHRILDLYHLSHAQWLQTDSGPKHRHIQGAIPSWFQCSSSHTFPTTIHSFRGQFVFQWEWPIALTSVLERFSGHSQSGWNPLLSCRNYLCYNEPARQILLQPIIYLLWGYIEPYIFPTGFTGISTKGFSMQFQFLLELSRLSFIQTFSTSTTLSKSSDEVWNSCSLGAR